MAKGKGRGSLPPSGGRGGFSDWETGYGGSAADDYYDKGGSGYTTRYGKKTGGQSSYWGGYAQGSYQTSFGKWSGPAWYWEPSQPYTDGSRVLVHDGHDVERANYERGQYTQFGKTVQAWRSAFPSVEGLADDLFWTMLKRAPDTSSNVPLRGVYEMHKPLIETLLEQEDFARVHAATVGDAYLAGRGAEGALNSILGALKEETMQRMAQAGGMQAEIDAKLARAGAFEELGQQPGAERLLEMAKKLREEAAQMQAELDALLAPGIDGEERDAMRNNLRAMLTDQKGVGQEIVATQESYQALSQAKGWDTSAGGEWTGRPMTEESRRALAKKIQQSSRVRKVAEIAGRMKLIAAKVQQRKARNVNSEITSIEPGADVERLLPEELSLLGGDPDMDMMFKIGFAEAALMQYEVHGKEDIGQGPIIVALDNSGSMDGEPDQWSKAVMLALLQIAAKQRRDFAVIHFDTRVARVEIFEKGQADPARLIENLTFFTGGGTYFDPWMAEALKMVKQSKWKQADVIAVTDGLASVDDRVAKEWNDARKVLGMRAYCVLIQEGGWGYDYGKETMEKLTDHLIVVKDVKDEMHEGSAVLNTLFSV